MNGDDRARDDDTAELEEVPSGGINAPWEDPVGEDPDAGTDAGTGAITDADTDGDATEAATSAAGDTGGLGEPAGDDPGDAGDGVSLGRKLLYLLPRVLGLILLVGVPITLGWSFFVWYFGLDLIGQMLSLLGFAYLVRWGLRPHLEDYFTHPQER